MAGYSGTPLPSKLGLKEGFAVALLGAPAGFRRGLAPLPPRISWHGELCPGLDCVSSSPPISPPSKNGSPRRPPR
jgi:hypothetical protein